MESPTGSWLRSERAATVITVTFAHFAFCLFTAFHMRALCRIASCERDCLRGESLPKPSLRVEIESVMKSDYLQSEERAFLGRWIADPRADDVWSKIEAAMHNKHGEFAEGLRGPFIDQVLALLAGYATDSNAFLKQAENAQSLARFLRGPISRPHPPLLANSEMLISSLEDAALSLRKMAANQIKAGLKQVSRMDQNGSRARVIFMCSVSELLKAFCGQSIDEAGIFLTDIGFPSQETTLDQIRAARRPTTRAKRRKPEK
jgi:hypothetical protein